jgi:hypothetical protein
LVLALARGLGLATYSVGHILSTTQMLIIQLEHKRYAGGHCKHHSSALVQLDMRADVRRFGEGNRFQTSFMFGRTKSENRAMKLVLQQTRLFAVALS